MLSVDGTLRKVASIKEMWRRVVRHYGFSYMLFQTAGSPGEACHASFSGMNLAVSNGGA